MRALGLVYDLEHPLERATYGVTRTHPEPRVANTCLNDYALMGDGRSLTRLWEYYQKAASTNPLYVLPIPRFSRLHTYSMRFAWKERIVIYDRQVRQQRAGDLNRFWLEARTSIPLRDYQQSERLRTLIDRTLDKLQDFIEEHEETVKGVTTVYKRVDIRTMVEALRMASDLQRRAAGMIDKQQVNWNIDFRSLPMQFLERLADGEDPGAVMEDYHHYVASSQPNIIDALPGSVSGGNPAPQPVGPESGNTADLPGPSA